MTQPLAPVPHRPAPAAPAFPAGAAGAAGRFSFAPPEIAVGPDGRPRPVDPATGRPVMTAAEANWHGHCAHMATSAAHRAAGESFLPVASAAAAAGDPRIVAGMPLVPFSMGHLLVLEMLGTAYTRPARADGAPQTVSTAELIRVAWALLHPEAAEQLLETGDTAALDREARAFAWKLTPADFAVVNEWVNREMAFFQAPAAAEAKKPLPAALPPIPGEAAAVTSPPSPALANPHQAGVSP